MDWYYKLDNLCSQLLWILNVAPTQAHYKLIHIFLCEYLTSSMSSYLSSYNLVRASNRRALLRHRKTPAKVAISTTFPLYLSPSLSVSLLLRYFRLLSVALTDTSRAPEHSFTNIIMPDSQSVRHRERERERETDRPKARSQLAITRLIISYPEAVRSRKRVKFP